MKFTNYLEYMTRKEMTNAGEAGQTNLQNLNKPEIPKDIQFQKLPPWLLFDAHVAYVDEDYYDDEYEDETDNEFVIRILGPNPKKELTRILGESIYDDDRVKALPSSKILRLVITINGKILWSRAIDMIHQEIIAYGMCIDAIPMREEFSEYAWSDNISSMETFICLEYTPVRDSKAWSLAESYGVPTAKSIAEYVGNYKGYMKAFQKLGIDENYLQL